MEQRQVLLLPTKDAFAALGVGRTTGFRLIAEGKLTARKLGGKTLVEADAMRRFVDSLPKVGG